MLMAGTLSDMMAVYEGREGADLLFQPRLRHWFECNSAAGSLPERYGGMYLDEIYEDLRVAPREVWRPGGGYLGFVTEQENEVEKWVGRRGGIISLSSIGLPRAQYVRLKGAQSMEPLHTGQSTYLRT